MTHPHPPPSTSPIPTGRHGALVLASLLAAVGGGARVLAAPAPVSSVGLATSQDGREGGADRWALEGAQADQPVIAAALGAVSDEVRTFNDHLTILASPWMEGRLPGTRGMELAKQYMEFHFRRAGLRGAFPAEVENADGTLAVEPYGSFRQAFKLGSSSTVESASLRLQGAGEPLPFRHGRDVDYTVTGMGPGGTVDAPAVFVGYAIENGPDGFCSFPEDTDLTGKVAVLLRFEPLGENGWSKWRPSGRAWTSCASFSAKLQAVEARGAVAAIIINTPGTADRRGRILQPAGGSSETLVQIPVIHMSEDAGQRLVLRGSGGAVTLERWRELADDQPLAVELEGRVAFHARVERRPKIAENIVAVLPGRGRLADEYVVVGAHLDHLGMGDFGSNDADFAGKKLHPGADDNASGSAGILLIAEKAARVYGELPDEADARTLLFIGFSAEESGLNGSRYYASNPIAPIDKHVLMMNFDMIGRIQDKRLSVSGTDTGAGLQDFLAPILQASPLTIVERGGASGGSDHQSFYQREVPVLFGILAKLHGDYHTSRDTSDLINRVDAVHAANLFFEIAVAAALRPEAFPFQRPSRAASVERVAVRTTPRVRLGVRLVASTPGTSIQIEAVTEGSTAAAAGVRPGDVLVNWNGRDVTDALALSKELRAASPGDPVEMVVLRSGRRVTLAKVALQAHEQRRAWAQRVDVEGRDAKQGAGPETTPPESAPPARPKVQFGVQPDHAAEGKGVLVKAVTDGSPAAAAGLVAGDRILTWNGEAIEGAGGLGALLGAADPGDVVQVEIQREGRAVRASVTLTARSGGS